MMAIFRREIRSYFHSVTGWLFAAFLLLFAGIYTMAYCLGAGYPNFEYVLGEHFIYLSYLRADFDNARLCRGTPPQDGPAALFAAHQPFRGCGWASTWRCCLCWRCPL